MPAPDIATPRQTTYLRSNNSDREIQSGTRRFVSQPSQQRMEGFTGTRVGGTIHTVHHRGLRRTKSNISHRGHKQQNLSRARTRAGRPTQHARVQVSFRVTIKPLSEKWNGGNNGVSLAKHDCVTNFSNFNFTHDITTATSAYDLQLRSRKQRSSSHDIKR